jgi:hypothetical protein
MSFKIVDEVLKHSKSTGAARLVLIVLAHHANEDTREAWPGLDVIAHEAAIGRSATCKALTRLEKMREVKRARSSGGYNQRTHYQIEALNSVLGTQFDEQNSVLGTQKTVSYGHSKQCPRDTRIKPSTNRKENRIAHAATDRVEAAAKQTDPRISQLMDHWSKRFKDKFGAPPLLNGKHAKHFQDALVTHDVDLLKQLLDAYITSKDPYVVNAGWSIDLFFNQISKLIAKRKPMRFDERPFVG